MKRFQVLLFSLCLLLACEEDPVEKKDPASAAFSAAPATGSPCQEDGIIDSIGVRNFKMGFSTWPYGPNSADQEDTYRFLKQKGDIYSEHMDDKIPWSAWLNQTALPAEFVDKVNAKASQKVANVELLLSVGLFNDGRDGIKEGFNGLPPTYDSLNQQNIEDAYFSHVNYLIEKLDPDYLVVAIEANDFYKNQPAQWPYYKALMGSIRTRLKQRYPNLPMSESITLHNYYLPDVPNPSAFIQEISSYIQLQDFAAISFYPFFKDLHSKADFQLAFDFLHAQVNKDIAFVETTHLAEDLNIPNLNTNILSDPCEQKDYLESLVWNAYKENYSFFIWWAHRDYDALWNTFPPAVKDLGQVWRDTGILDENGVARPAYQTWERIRMK